MPLLIVPPTINKYYALDLAPDRSLVEFLVRQGQQVFVISWRNPDARHAALGLRHLRSGGPRRARRRRAGHRQPTVPRSPASAPAASSPAIAAAYLAGDRTAGPAGRARPCRHGHRQRAGRHWHRRSVDRAAGRARPRRRPDAEGYLDGRALAEVFAWLRPGDLIWNYWVNNYLLGKKPPAFDILFWNADTTRMTAGLHADFVDLAMDNQLVTGRGALTVLGVPIDLSRIDIDSYVVAGIADHITPWQSCYRSTQLLRRHDTVRPVHQRPHRGAGQPAGQPQGELPGEQGQPAPTRPSGS